ncbi:MAG: hypothetical protein QM640_12105 [Niabella sp.]
MATKKEWKTEYCFTRESLEKLLKDNPDAKNIIIRHSIVMKRISKNVTLPASEILACADNGSKKAVKAAQTECVPGCPYPPGCN